MNRLASLLEKEEAPKQQNRLAGLLDEQPAYPLTDPGIEMPRTFSPADPTGLPSSEILKTGPTLAQDIAHAGKEIPQNLKIGTVGFGASLLEAVKKRAIQLSGGGHLPDDMVRGQFEPVTPEVPYDPRLNRGTVAQFLGTDRRPPIPGAITAEAFGVVTRLPDVGAKLIREKQGKMQAELPEDAGGVTKISRMVTQNLPGMAASITASMLTGDPIIGLMMLGESEGGQAFQTQLDKGASVKKAAILSDLSEAAEIGGEMLVFPKFIKGLKRGFPLQKAFTLILENAGQEGITGFNQQFLDTFGEETSKGSSLKVAVRKAFDAGIRAVPENALVGGITAGMIEATGGSVQAGRQVVKAGKNRLQSLLIPHPAAQTTPLQGRTAIDPTRTPDPAGIASDSGTEAAPNLMQETGLPEQLKPEVEKALRRGVLDYSGITYISDTLKRAGNAILNFIEPSKNVERKIGKDVYAEVVQGTFGIPEAKMLEFEQQVLDTIDKDVSTLHEFFSHYSEADLKNLMMMRGRPFSEMGKEMQKQASMKVPAELQDQRIFKAIQELADRNYAYLQSVVGDDVSKIRDYFYGLYKDPQTVNRFLDDWYKTTQRMTKEKVIPTVADAAAFGLELKSNNPVVNLRSEFNSIARLDALTWLRDTLLERGRGLYIREFPEAPSDWVSVGNEPVFSGYKVDPNLGRMINNLISTNKVTQNKFLSGLRNINNVLRAFKFTGSIFHMMTESMQSIADNPYLSPVRKSSLAGFSKGFKKNDPIFRTEPYKEYVRLGGGHKYSIESQSVDLVERVMDAVLSERGKKLMNTPVPGLPGYAKWMFDEWIPKIKYTKYLDGVAQQESKLGRALTDAEKIEIIKEAQNFYGEMNERLFGRSGTMTSVLRFIFLAPGFAEGNYRTIAKAATQWGFGDTYRAGRSRANIFNTLFFSALLAAIATRILSGEWPEPPETAEDLRDVWKIKTGHKDRQGRDVYVDTLTYGKDYANFITTLAQGRPDKFASETWKRLGGMKSPFFDVATDLAQLSMNKPLYDWKGDRVTEVTDPFLRKMMKLLAYEAEKLQPIGYSVYKQGRDKELARVSAAIQAFSGLRPTLSEKDIREKQVLHKIYSLRGQQETLYQYLRTLPNPRKAVEQYNDIVKEVLSSKYTPAEMRKEWEPELIIDLDRLTTNKQDAYLSSSHTEKEANRIREFIVNMGQTPRGIWEVEDIRPRLSAVVKRRRSLAGLKDAGTLDYEQAAKLKLLEKLQRSLTSLSKEYAEAGTEAEKQEIADTIREILDIAEAE